MYITLLWYAICLKFGMVKECAELPVWNAGMSQEMIEFPEIVITYSGACSITGNYEFSKA